MGQIILRAKYIQQGICSRSTLEGIGILSEITIFPEKKMTMNECVQNETD